MNYRPQKGGIYRKFAATQSVHWNLAGLAGDDPYRSARYSQQMARDGPPILLALEVSASLAWAAKKSHKRLAT
jgi:hypothetical protein